MDEHIHSGFVTFLVVTVYAVLGIQAIRFLSARLVDNPTTQPVGEALGALVHFG